ncbi:MAG: PQQ-dependent sugar dehydrogenase, partial [Pseudomonadales bacterium]|nr:PQQ-dependent sugar dehydrogenase [Pseudomonadales bacterium]
MIRSFRHSCALALLCASCASPLSAHVQSPVLGTGPWVFPTFEQDFLKVSVLARGLDHPFGLVFIPGTASADNPLGDILFTERNIARVRLFRNGVLLDEPVADMREVFSIEQLFDIKLHPNFEQNHLLYFTYIKTAPNPDGNGGYWVTTVLARGRYEDGRITNLEDVYEADAWSGNIGGASSRLHFLEDGTLLFGVSHRIDEDAPQALDSDIGKILRLNDDGSTPNDNPFIGTEGARSQIYVWGIRSVMDFTTHPHTGKIWEVENGPQGGDEVNILEPARNYGWPIATFGRDYDGTRFTPRPQLDDTELPFIFWVPSITVSSLRFYTGDVFPNWKDNLFVTSMIVGRIPNTGHLERVVLNDDGELRREQLLNQLHQRIRYVVQGPDELIYLLTDHTDGAFLRLEPGTAEEAALFANQPVTMEEDLAGETLVFADADCIACHRTEKVLLGPSYRDIATRYALNDANLALLASKVIE